MISSQLRLTITYFDSRSIHLPEDNSESDHRASKIVGNMTLIPLFLLKMAGAAWAWAAYRFKAVFRKSSRQIELYMDDNSI
jgi:hypothetical protein